MDKTCETCAYYTTSILSQEHGVLWWKKTVQVNAERCLRFGPHAAYLTDARGSWRAPAVVGPGAHTYYVDGLCGADGKFWEPNV